jgi:hypothetical protein
MELLEQSRNLFDRAKTGCTFSSSLPHGGQSVPCSVGAEAVRSSVMRSRAGAFGSVGNAREIRGSAMNSADPHAVG